MNCNCLTMCRVPEIMESRPNLPLPKHRPNCNLFIQETFAKVTHDGISCIMELNEGYAMVLDSDENYEISKILLTRDQFNNFHEFEGF